MPIAIGQSLDRLALPMVLLQRLDREALGLNRSHCPYTRFDAADRGQNRDTGFDGGAANFYFVLSRSLAARSIDDQVDIVVLDHINNVWTSLSQLEKPVHSHSRSGQSGCGPARCINREPLFNEVLP